MIHFDLQRLPILQRFKNDTIQMCLNFIKDVIKSSSNSKPKNLHQKLTDIEQDLYDIFCRWIFNAIHINKFDHDLFLPTGSFIIMKDIAYYLNRFNINMEDTLMSFPVHEFEHIRKRAQLMNHTPVLESVPNCSFVQLDRLKSLYQGHDIDTDIAKLISRYVFLGGLNNSLSTPPSVLSVFPSHELFGTPLNTCTPTFCSPFEDESIFQSSGSFFTFTDYQEDTIYFANPPFDDVLCTHMAKKLLTDLESTSFALVVIIPVWDTLQQQKYGLKDFNMPFDAYNLLVNSPHYNNEVFLPKNQYPFFNYFYNKFVYISNTHMINLGKKVDLIALQDTWKNYKK